MCSEPFVTKISNSGERTAPPVEPVPAIGVVIPTLNRSDVLQRALLALLQQSASHLREIIVVDDGSTDDTERVVRRMAESDARIAYLRNSGKGLGRAKFLGTRLCRAEYICYLDDDAIAQPSWIEAVASAIGHGASIVQSRLMEPGQQPNDAPPARLRWDMWFRTNWVSTCRMENVPFCQECGVVIRRDILDSVPFFDPDLRGTSNQESLSFSLRARAAGYRIAYEPHALVLHVPPGRGGSNDLYPETPDWKKSSQFAKERYYNTTILQLKFCGWRWPFAVFLNLLRIIPRLARNRSLKFLCESAVGVLEALTFAGSKSRQAVQCAAQ